MKRKTMNRYPGMRGVFAQVGDVVIENHPVSHLRRITKIDAANQSHSKIFHTVRVDGQGRPTRISMKTMRRFKIYRVNNVTPEMIERAAKARCGQVNRWPSSNNEVIEEIWLNQAEVLKDAYRKVVYEILDAALNND